MMMVKWLDLVLTMMIELVRGKRVTTQGLKKGQRSNEAEDDWSLFRGLNNQRKRKGGDRK